MKKLFFRLRFIIKPSEENISIKQAKQTVIANSSFEKNKGTYERAC